MDTRCRVENLLGKFGDGADDMFAIVNDEQHLRRIERSDDAGCFVLAPYRQSECRRKGARDHSLIAQGCQINEDDGLGELRQQAFGNSQGYSRLTDATSTEDRHETVYKQLLPDTLNRIISSDEFWRPHGQRIELRDRPHGRRRESGSVLVTLLYWERKAVATAGTLTI